MPGYGAGRLSLLSSALPLRHCVDVIKSHLRLSHLRLARAVGQNIGKSDLRPHEYCDDR